MHFVVIVKLAGKLWSYEQQHTPFDVVAWHGKYADIATSIL
jgi:homogentisate 1,2-dioxygenase